MTNREVNEIFLNWIGMNVNEISIILFFLFIFFMFLGSIFINECLIGAGVFCFILFCATGLLPNANWFVHIVSGLVIWWCIAENLKELKTLFKFLIKKEIIIIILLFGFAGNVFQALK